ncbi:MAG: RluA family pseudouridine synthase [Eubacteriales bacterium]
MKRIIPYYIHSNTCGVTIYDYLKSQGYSNPCITTLKKTNHSICINSRWEYMNYRLQDGDCLTVTINETNSSTTILPREIPLSIVYEDEDILVVNKQANLPIHPSMNHYEDTLANGIMHYFHKQHIPHTFRCMNRIDKDTTGLVLLAKHFVSSSILSKQIQGNTVKREYLAIISGTPTPLVGTINAPIGRVADSSIEREVQDTGETAITHYETLQSNEKYSLIRLRLETGRTHQIRVHMQWIGHPLLGDTLYHLDEFNSPLSRQALHSSRLSFLHPIKNEAFSLVAPLPNDMKKVLRNLL